MKQNIFKIVLLFIVIGITSCDYLDKTPDDELTLEMVFRDKTRTEDWLAGIYKGIPDPYMPMVKNYDSYGDDFSPSAGWEVFGWDAISKIKGNWNSESSWNGGFWSSLPTKIRSAYILIENVKPNAELNVTQQEVDYMKAECRVLIAYYYYLMLNTYGAIPLQTWLSDFDEPTETLMIGQTPFDDVVNWIDKELLEASKLLPPYYNETYKYGRVTSVMALAVRARMLLFAASPLVNGNQDPEYLRFTNDKGELIFNPNYDQTKWDRATKACKELIDLAESNGHQLYVELAGDGTVDAFMSYSNMSYVEAHLGNKEILFARPDADFGDYSLHAVPRGSSGNGGLGVTQSLVDAFFMNNGLPAILGYHSDGSPIINEKSGYTESGFSTSEVKAKTKWIEGASGASSNNLENVITPSGTYNMYVNREPRFYCSVLFNDAWYRISQRKVNFYKDGQDGGITHDAPQNGYLVRKRIHPNTDMRNNVKPYRPGILYRLGEAYLNYAEALNESNPANKDEILNYLNPIRRRAGIPIYGSGKGEIPVPKDQNEMREAIRRERRVEFNCEYAIRYDDIRRWKQMDLLKGNFYGMNYYGTEKSDDENNPNAYYVRKPYITRAFGVKNYFIPIHQNQIDKNSNLRQLPYW